MFVLALILLLAAAALILWVVFGLNNVTNNDVHFDAWGNSTSMKPLTVFILGAVALLLIWAATRLIAHATRRKMERRRERKAMEKENRRNVEQRDAAYADRDEAYAQRDEALTGRETAEARQRVAERDTARAENGGGRGFVNSDYDDNAARQRVADRDAARGEYGDASAAPAGHRSDDDIIAEQKAKHRADNAQFQQDDRAVRRDVETDDVIEDKPLPKHYR